MKKNKFIWPEAIWFIYFSLSPFLSVFKCLIESILIEENDRFVSKSWNTEKRIDSESMKVNFDLVCLIENRICCIFIFNREAKKKQSFLDWLLSRVDNLKKKRNRFRLYSLHRNFTSSWSLMPHFLSLSPNPLLGSEFKAIILIMVVVKDFKDFF